MPKISYVDKTKQGFDDTEVTALQIEQKIAEINALLRGMIDEDNLLLYDTNLTLNINPSVVIDLPGETRPVNHCMKFFGVTSSEQDGIVDDLFQKLAKRVDDNPDFSCVGGLGDGDIVWSFNDLIKGDEVEGQQMVKLREKESKTKSIEIPANYVPMKWSDVYNYCGDIIRYVFDENTGIFSVWNATTNVDDFIAEICENGKDAYAESMDIYKEQTDGTFGAANISASKLSRFNFSRKSNMLSWDMHIGVTFQSYLTEDDDAFLTVRLSPSILCRILP
jgi:hypothetical protein